MNLFRKTAFLLVFLSSIFSPLSVFAQDQLIATIKGTGTGAQVYSVSTDHLTGSNVVTNSSGSIEELMDYYPYGDIRLDEKAGTFNEQRKYAGQEYDGDTGLSYMNARYYNGKVGRFVSVDPLIFANPEKFLDDPQGLNTYSYVKNNPLRYNDPTGKLWKEFLEEYIQNVSNVVTMAIPGISDARDAYELNSGKDLISQRTLTQGEKEITSLGAFIPFALSGKEIRIINNTTKQLNNAARGVISIPKGSNLRFSQTTVNATFDSKGFFKGATRDSVIQSLKNGTINPSSIEVNYLERDGYRVIENNRSASVLMEAGIPESKWNLQRVNPKSDAAGRINSHLQNNNLPSTGIDTINYKK